MYESQVCSFDTNIFYIIQKLNFYLFSFKFIIIFYIIYHKYKKKIPDILLHSILYMCTFYSTHVNVSNISDDDYKYG